MVFGSHNGKQAGDDREQDRRPNAERGLQSKGKEWPGDCA